MFYNFAVISRINCKNVWFQVDASLSFLDGFVAEALSNGAAPYKPHHQRQEEKLSREKGACPISS